MAILFGWCLEVMHLLQVMMILAVLMLLVMWLLLLQLMLLDVVVLVVHNVGLRCLLPIVNHLLCPAPLIRVITGIGSRIAQIMEWIRVHGVVQSAGG